MRTAKEGSTRGREKERDKERLKRRKEEGERKTREINDQVLLLASLIGGAKWREVLGAIERNV